MGTGYADITAAEKHELMGVLNQFPLVGNLKRITRITKANVNAIYLVEADRGKYILRKSNPRTTPEQLAFEETVLCALEQKRCGFVPRIIRTKDHQTTVETAGNPITRFRLFSFLEGENRYEWTSRNFAMEEYASMFRFMAQLHALLADLDIKNAATPFTVLSFLEQFPEELDNKLAIAPQDRFTEALRNHAAFITQQCKEVRQVLLNLSYHDVPKQVIHTDIHLGNMLFQDGQVSGIVDFDWVTIESPWWDFAYSFTQNGTYCGEQDGRLNAELFAVALKSYVGEKKLADNELKLVQMLVKATDLRNVKWTMDSYYEPSLSHIHEKCVHYLEHFLATLTQDEYNKLGAQ